MRVPLVLRINKHYELAVCIEKLATMPDCSNTINAAYACRQWLRQEDAVEDSEESRIQAEGVVEAAEVRVAQCRQQCEQVHDLAGPHEPSCH